MQNTTLAAHGWLSGQLCGVQHSRSELWDGLLEQKDRESAKGLIAYKEVPGSLYNVAQAPVEWNSVIQQGNLSRIETRGGISAVGSCATIGGSYDTTNPAS